MKLDYLAVAAMGGLMVAAAWLVTEYKPPRPFIEFQSVEVAETCSPGKPCVLVYWLRRNRSCATHINTRWFSVELGAYVSRYSADFQAAQADISKDDGFDPFPVHLPIPTDIAPGRWLYGGTMRCEDETVPLPVASIMIEEPNAVE